MTTVVSFRFSRFVLVVSEVLFDCLRLVHAVTFQTSHMGKDKLCGVGKVEHVLLAREGRKVKIIAIFLCFGGSGGLVPAVLVVSFQWFRVLVHATYKYFSVYVLHVLCKMVN